MLRKVLFLITLCIPIPSYTQDISFASGHWSIDAQGHVLESHQGYEGLYLKGGRAVLQEVAIENFELDFDIYLKERRSFSGVMFRMADSENYEEIYFRGHLSGQPDAMQYTPVFNGNSSWQLYHSQARPIFDGQIGWEVDSVHGYNNLYHYDFNGWMHVKLIVKGMQAELFLDDVLVLRISDLKHDQMAGGIGFKSGLGGAHFANVSYKVIEVDLTKPEIPVMEPNVVNQWALSSTFSDSLLLGPNLSAGQIDRISWDAAVVEPSGLLNISKFRKRSREANTVLVKTTIQVDENEIRSFSFGYSDSVSLYFNGQKIYSGNNGYRSRDYRFLGTIGLFDQVYLPLKKGENVLMIAVSEVFGGWGIIGAFPENN